MRNLFVLFIILSATTSLCGQTETNPFAKHGLKKVMMATSSKGEFKEFHYNKEVIEIGSILYNTKTKEVIGYIDENIENDVTSATPAMSIDPDCEKYYWISPYAYCLNNPVRFIDPTGKWIAGTDGKRVEFKNGKWSSNASGDVKRVGNAMMGTETGTERLNFMFKHDEKISINLSNKEVRTDDGIGYITGTNKRTDQKLSKDGSIKVGEHKITINTGSIEKLISPDAGNNPLKGLTMDQAIGAIAGHESGHTEKGNTKQSYENTYKGMDHNLETRPDEIMNKILKELEELKK